MILKADPVCRAVEEVRDLRRREGRAPRVVLLSPQGRVFDQETANRLAGEAAVILVCGHYKALDERVRESVVDEEISLGDFVLTGGEAASAVVVEAVARLLPGVLGDEESYRSDSFYQGRLDGPYYTRPRVFRGLEVPDVLLSGDHERIRRWRVRESLRRTLERRPDLLAGRELDPEEREILSELGEEARRQFPAGLVDSPKAASVDEQRRGVENHGTG